MRIYAIYDSKAAYFQAPFYERNNATAIRAFMQAAREKGPYNSFAADYTLFCIGEYDDLSGKITGRDSYENLGTALQYLEDNR